MKHIIKLLENTLSSPTANLKCGIPAAALGGIISGIGGIAGGAMSSSSQYSANGQNMRLTREGWKIQQQEAEKSRQFNSEEAEKAREYYSEGAIMKRRQEAGLNTALEGSQSATSGASAQGSSANISSPIPMQSTDFTPLSNGLQTAISNYFGFKQTELQGAKVSAETERVLQDIIQDKAMHEVSIRMNTQQIENLTKQNEELSLKNTQLRNAVRLERIQVNGVFNRFYNDWVTNKMAQDNVKIEGGKFILMYQKDRAKIMAEARNFANQLRIHKVDLQYKYGGRSRHGATYGQNSNDTNSSGWSVNGKFHSEGSVSAGVLGFGKVDGSTGVELGGNYTTSQQRTTAEMVGVSASSEQTFANTEVGKMLAEVEGALLILESPDSSDEVIRNALDVILRANYSFEAFTIYYEKIRPLFYLSNSYS